LRRFWLQAVLSVDAWSDQMQRLQGCGSIPSHVSDCVVYREVEDRLTKKVVGPQTASDP
jgi:hypothetical protein